jgi:hypothetical protein
VKDTHSEDNDSNSISPVCRALIESLEDLGDSGKSILVSNMQRRGIFMNDRRVSLLTLHHILIELMGEQATSVIMENIIIDLDRIHGSTCKNEANSIHE